MNFFPPTKAQAGGYSKQPTLQVFSNPTTLRPHLALDQQARRQLRMPEVSQYRPNTILHSSELDSLPVSGPRTDEGASRSCPSSSLLAPPAPAVTSRPGRWSSAVQSPRLTPPPPPSPPWAPSRKTTQLHIQPDRPTTDPARPTDRTSSQTDRTSSQTDRPQIQQTDRPQIKPD